MEEKKAVAVSELAQTGFKVITSPATFFREMPKGGGISRPLAFMVMMGVINGLVTAALGLFDMASNPIFSTGMTIVSLVLYPFAELSHTPILSTGMAIASIVLYPLAYAVFGFAGAGLVCTVWKLLGSRESYETSYSCVAYLAAFMPLTTLLLVIPYGGLLVSVALLTYLYVLISRKVHGIERTRAWLVFGLIGVMLFLMGIGADIRAQEFRQKTAALPSSIPPGNDTGPYRTDAIDAAEENTAVCGGTFSMGRRMPSHQFFSGSNT